MTKQKGGFLTLATSAPDGTSLSFPISNQSVAQATLTITNPTSDVYALYKVSGGRAQSLGLRSLGRSVPRWQQLMAAGVALADLHSRSLDPCGRRVRIHACTRHDTTCDMTGEDEPARAIPRAAKPGPHRAVGVFIGWQRELDGRDLYFNRSGAQTVSCMHLELIRV